MYELCSFFYGLSCDWHDRILFMSHAVPTEVYIREVGPREGLQTSAHPIPVPQMKQLVELLSETGVKEIEVASFVKSEKVPAMDIAESLCKELSRGNTRFSALYLNAKGFERALPFSAIQNQGWLQTSVSDSFLAKNANSTFEKSISSIKSLIELTKLHKVPFEGVMLSCAFGCVYEGVILEQKIIEKVKVIFNEFLTLGVSVPLLVLADTAGMGNPEQVKKIITQLRDSFPKVRIGLHLHDTRGLGIANAYTGFQVGVDYFDASVAGVGGCPFVQGATGNIATEELLYLCNSIGIKTNISLERYVDAAKFAATIFGNQVSSRLLKSKL